MPESHEELKQRLLKESEARVRAKLEQRKSSAPAGQEAPADGPDPSLDDLLEGDASESDGLGSLDELLGSDTEKEAESPGRDSDGLASLDELLSGEEQSEEEDSDGLGSLNDLLGSGDEASELGGESPSKQSTGEDSLDELLDDGAEAGQQGDEDSLDDLLDDGAEAGQQGDEDSLDDLLDDGAGQTSSDGEGTLDGLLESDEAPEQKMSEVAVQEGSDEGPEDDESAGADDDSDLGSLNDLMLDGEGSDEGPEDDEPAGTDDDSDLGSLNDLMLDGEDSDLGSLNDLMIGSGEDEDSQLDDQSASVSLASEEQSTAGLDEFLDGLVSSGNEESKGSLDDLLGDEPAEDDESDMGSLNELLNDSRDSLDDLLDEETSSEQAEGQLEDDDDAESVVLDEFLDGMLSEIAQEAEQAEQPEQADAVQDPPTRKKERISKPNCMLACFICGAWFNNGSLAPHFRNCLKKRVLEEPELAHQSEFLLMQCVPIPVGGVSSQAAVDQFNSNAQETYRQSLPTCPSCGHRARKPSLQVICHLCGKQFPIQQLSIHIPQCRSRIRAARQKKKRRAVEMRRKAALNQAKLGDEKGLFRMSASRSKMLGTSRRAPDSNGPKQSAMRFQSSIGASTQGAAWSTIQLTPEVHYIKDESTRQRSESQSYAKPTASSGRRSSRSLAASSGKLEAVELTATPGSARDTARSSRAVVCHICGSRFTIASLAFHIQSCLQKHRTAQKEVQEYNQAAVRQLKASQHSCPGCRKSFKTERLLRHMRDCCPALLRKAMGIDQPTPMRRRQLEADSIVRRSPKNLDSTVPCGASRPKNSLQQSNIGLTPRASESMQSHSSKNRLQKSNMGLTPRASESMQSHSSEGHATDEVELKREKIEDSDVDLMEEAHDVVSNQSDLHSSQPLTKLQDEKENNNDDFKRLGFDADILAAQRAGLLGERLKKQEEDARHVVEEKEAALKAAVKAAEEEEQRTRLALEQVRAAKNELEARRATDHEAVQNAARVESTTLTGVLINEAGQRQQDAAENKARQSNKRQFVTIKVPEGGKPGQQLNVKVNGQQCATVCVPMDAKAGDPIQVELPSGDATGAASEEAPALTHQPDGEPERQRDPLDAAFEQHYTELTPEERGEPALPGESEQLPEHDSNGTAVMEPLVEEEAAAAEAEEEAKAAEEAAAAKAAEEAAAAKAAEEAAAKAAEEEAAAAKAAEEAAAAKAAEEEAAAAKAAEEAAAAKAAEEAAAKAAEEEAAAAKAAEEAAATKAAEEEAAEEAAAAKAAEEAAAKAAEEEEAAAKAAEEEAAAAKAAEEEAAAAKAAEEAAAKAAEAAADKAAEEEAAAAAVAEEAAKHTSSQTNERRRRKSQDLKAELETAEEEEGVVAEPVAQMSADATELFNVADKDESGTLSRSELKKAIQQAPDLRDKLGINKWKDFFDQIDTNGDGQIMLQAFVQYYVETMQNSQEEVVRNVPPDEPSATNEDDHVLVNNLVDDLDPVHDFDNM